MLKKTLIATAAIAILGPGLFAMTTFASADTPSNLSGFIEPGQNTSAKNTNARTVNSEQLQSGNCIVKRERHNGQMVNVRICKTIF